MNPTPHADLVRRQHLDALGPLTIYLAGAFAPGIGSAAAWSLACAIGRHPDLELHLRRALRGQLVGVAALLLLQGALAAALWAARPVSLPAPAILAVDLVFVGSVWLVSALSGLWGARGAAGPTPLPPSPTGASRGARVRFTPTPGRRTSATPVVVEPTRSRAFRAAPAPLGDRPTRRVERPR